MQLSEHATISKTLICQLTSKFPNSRTELTSTSYTSQTSLEVKRTNGKVTTPTHTAIYLLCLALYIITQQVSIWHKACLWQINSQCPFKLTVTGLI